MMNPTHGELPHRGSSNCNPMANGKPALLGRADPDDRDDDPNPSAPLGTADFERCAELWEEVVYDPQNTRMARRDGMAGCARA
jgi:hypothetical protein